MKKFDSGSLFFSAASVREAKRLMPRIIRTIFYGLGITNDRYLQSWADYNRFDLRNHSKTSRHTKARSDRTDLISDGDLTFKKVNGTIEAMGFYIKTVQFTIVDRNSGEEYVFSTDDTIAELDELRAKVNEIGIDSF